VAHCVTFAGRLRGGFAHGDCLGCGELEIIERDEADAASLAPKSATTPIAIAAGEKIGGFSSLTVLLVIPTGVFGAVTARGMLNVVGMRETQLRGFAIGLRRTASESGACFRWAIKRARSRVRLTVAPLTSFAREFLYKPLFSFASSTHLVRWFLQNWC
jgi:hypothetical protein